VESGDYVAQKGLSGNSLIITRHFVSLPPTREVSLTRIAYLGYLLRVFRCCHPCAKNDNWRERKKLYFCIIDNKKTRMQ
jgi:hypothetical protein